MNLDLDVQLQVALRALEEVIAPALGDAEKQVVEQLHLAITTIDFVRQRLPDARNYARIELAAYARLAEESAAIASGAEALAATAAQARAVMASAEADTATIVAATRRLREEVTALGSRCTDPKACAMLDQLVLEQGATMAGQARQWGRPFGFELNPQDLPDPAW